MNEFGKSRVLRADPLPGLAGSPAIPVVRL
jgi:hypothetical protein